MAHLYGVRPWEMKRLTIWQLGALRSQANWILYLRDRAMREYAYMKIDQDKLATMDLGTPPTPLQLKARERYYASYGLPEHRRPRMTRQAALDFRRALDARRVPPWALNMVDLEEIAELTETR